MNPNSENNSDKEKEAEIAANRLVEMLEQQALYRRIAKINEETKSNVSDEETVEPPLSIVAKSPKTIYLKWAAIAASLLIGGFLFLFEADTTPATQLTLANTAFRGAESTQSRSVINGEEVRTTFADIDDLIESGEFARANELLDGLDKEEEQVGKIYREGILAYLSSNFTAAAHAFSEIVKINDREYIEDAYWNLLLSHEKANNLTEAVKVAEEMQSNKYITKKQKNAALNLVEALPI